jgi:DNA topoisomerase-1
MSLSPEGRPVELRIPGYAQFQYLDDAGERPILTSTEVNAYLHEIAGEEITAKDFRTRAGTNLAALALREFENVDTVLRMIEHREGSRLAVSRAGARSPSRSAASI